MSEELGVAVTSALVSALVGLAPQVSWDGLTDRIRTVLRRRGRPVDPDRQPELDAALRGNGAENGGAENGGGAGQGPPEERARSLAALLAGLRPDDRDAVLAELRAMTPTVTSRPQVTVTGDQNVVHSGQGDQNVTFN